ncbi:hypothetical protein [Mesorhizobium sp. RMAD-H1]|uniref:hypothetical protein n=1 Tax=Mesorhizobium sp. RMAD-H1 TaxID=2587065 RepID=UPI0016105086|nr:hypothetical protein [Mesorhizobium sp. RMAD-H1]MBB2972835.1 hypothetical protein [Mesorhizobium sp. RMAD-H1]
MLPQERDPHHHTRKMKSRLQETMVHLREDIEKVGDPQSKALLETSAEVLEGFTQAFNHYERKGESAWQA